MIEEDFDTIRTAKEVIDNAISENKLAEFLMYGFAFVFVLIGLFILIYSVLNDNILTSVIGLVVSSLFLPAMTSARRTRKENIAIRLLEAPLSRADTSKEAAEMLHKLLDTVIRDNKNDG